MQSHDPAEEPCAQYGASGPPEGENDQGYGDPALAGRQVVRPHMRGAQGKIGSAHTYDKGSAKDADPAHADRADARCRNGIRVFSCSAEGQTCGRAFEEEPEKWGQQIREIDQRVVLKKYRAEKGELPQQREGEGLEAFGQCAYKGRAQII